MSNPGPGAIYRYCLLCKRPFRLWGSRVRRGAKYCSVACFHASLKAYHEALASDRLEFVVVSGRLVCSERVKVTGEGSGGVS
jgi:hypothetical protein